MDDDAYDFYYDVIMLEVLHDSSSLSQAYRLICTPSVPVKLQPNFKSLPQHMKRILQ